LMAVVFPAPFVPTSAKALPSGTFTEKSLSAQCRPYSLVTLRNSTITCRSPPQPCPTDSTPPTRPVPPLADLHQCASPPRRAAAREVLTRAFAPGANSTEGLRQPCRFRAELLANAR